MKTRPKEGSHAIRRWVCFARPQEKPADLPPHGAGGGQGLPGARRIAKSMEKIMDPKSAPFDVKRMVYGGFKILVDA